MLLRIWCCLYALILFCSSCVLLFDIFFFSFFLFVFICFPGSSSDFLPIHEWVRGSVNYKVIRALRTFKMAKVIKTFHAWSKFTKHCKFLAKRSAGVGKTFIATHAFCSTIVRINGLLRDMNGTTLAEGFKRVKSVAQSYQSGEFMRVQQETRTNGKDVIESITERYVVVKKS